MTDLAIAQPEALDPGTSRDASLEVRSALDQLSGDPRLVHVRRIAPRTATFRGLARDLPEQISQAAPHLAFWSHQARAIDLARDGISCALATGTASGKSLAYQIPIAEAALDGATSLLIYPTKALAHDQLLSFGAWDLGEMVAAAYDGDCTPPERLWVRDNATVVLTNPEMLHQGILPNHRRWAVFLRALRLVVVDELHVLRGVFGTHVAQVLRRLRRLVLHHGGSEPTFIFTSATIGNAEGLASQLCGAPVVGVDGDGSPSGDRYFALWHPGMGELEPEDRGAPSRGADEPGAEEPGADEPDYGKHGSCNLRTRDPGAGDRSRWSLHGEAARLATTLVETGLRTLVFCPSRRGTELVAEEIRRSLPGALSESVRSYRAGYLSSERRQIESELFTGQLRCVVATNALELGIDIGGLDAVVMCGFPGTISSFWQQVGRGGRSTGPSLAVLVAGQDQLDQWMVRNPDELFNRAPEAAVINLDNPHVFVPHLGCAAHEVPLHVDDAAYWPSQLDEGVRRLVISDRASVRRRRVGPAVVWSGRGTPAPTIGLRSASRGEYRICDPAGQTIGTVDESRVASVLHPGAIYLHQGQAWRVIELDMTEHEALVEPATGDHYTQPRSTSDIQLIDEDRSRLVGAATLSLGTVEVTSQVTGYRVRDSASHEQLSSHPLDLAASHLTTRAIWYYFDEATTARARIDASELPGALHAAEHAAIGILPLFTICDRWDVGGVSTAYLPETGGATVVIHDAHPGGAGVSELAYEAADRHLLATLSVITGCGCDHGCPSCVQSPKCGNNNEPLDKAAATRLLRAALTCRPSA